MRRNLGKILCGVLLSALVVRLGFATVTPNKTDAIDYCTGANNANCIFQIDASGNVTAAGNMTVQGSETVVGNSVTTGQTVFSPSQVVVSTSTTISPVGTTYIQLLSSGGIVSLGATAGNCTIPIVSTLTATNGQFLVLDSTSTTAYVTFLTTGPTCGIVTTTTPPISLQTKPIDFIYDGPQGLWKQIQQ